MEVSAGGGRAGRSPACRMALGAVLLAEGVSAICKKNTNKMAVFSRGPISVPFPVPSAERG